MKIITTKQCLTNRMVIIMLILLTGSLYLVAGKTDNRVDELAKKLLISPKFSNIQLSPDGKHLAMYSINQDHQRLYLWNLNKQKGHGYDVRSGHDVYDYGWIDGDNIIFGYGRLGRYHEGLYAINEKISGDAVQIDKEFIKSALRLAYSMPYVPYEAILYDQMDKRVMTYYRYNFKRKRLYKIHSGEGKAFDYVFDLQGNMRVKVVLNDETHDWEFYHRWKEHSAWEKMDLDHEVAFHGFDPSGKILYVSHRDETHSAVLQGFDVEKMGFFGEAIKDPVYGVNPHLIRSQKNGDILGFSYEADKPVVKYMDSKIGNAMAMIKNALPDLTHEFLGYRADGSLLCSSWSDRQPLMIHNLNLKKKSLEAVLATYPDHKKEKMAEMVPFACNSSDGEVKLRGYYTLPPKYLNLQKPYPTVVIVHGGPQARDRWQWDQEVQFFALLGYAVLQVNYRGSEDLYGENTYTYLDIIKHSVDDVATATEAMAAAGLADKDRIAIYGWSFGGYVAVASAAKYPQLYQCSVGAAGVYDFEMLFKDRQYEYGKGRTLNAYGEFTENMDKFIEVSPYTMADRINMPVYLLHGDGDTNVSVFHSRKMNQALLDNGKSVKFDSPAWVNHGLHDTAQRIKFTKRIYQFIEDNMPGDSIK